MDQLIEAKEKAVMDAVRINEVIAEQGPNYLTQLQELKQQLEEIDLDRSLRDQEVLSSRFHPFVKAETGLQEKATILATEDIVQSGGQSCWQN